MSHWLQLGGYSCNKHCSCKGKNKPCSTGCECTNCTNTSTYDNSATLTSEDTSLLDVTVKEYLDEVSHTDSTGNNVIPDGIDDLMDWVFGEDNSVSEEEYL